MKKNIRRHNVRRGVVWLVSMGLACLIALCGFNVGAIVNGAPKAQAFAEANVQQATMPVADPSPAAYVYQRNTNSVVGVITNAQSWNRNTGEVDETPYSEGSGVVIQAGGFVLTNYHVIESGNSYQILMPSGEKANAVVVGSDSSLDLAVLQVEDKYRAELQPVEIGSSSDLVVGSTVIAIGNPGGEILANTVTQGVVSALERSSVNGSNTTRNVNYIQHDAAINNGNSGGGLFNYKGQLVGINTLKYAGSVYSNVSIEGLGFAIPIDTAYPIAQQLIEHGEVIRPQLGITVVDQEGPDEPMTSYPPASICVRSVNADGPAEKAGIKQYDFIYAVNDERVTSFRELTSVLDKYKAGESVKITVVRYDQAYIQPYNNYNNYYGMFGNFFGGFGGYGGSPYGNNGGSDSTQSDDQNGQLVVGGNYRFVTVEATLELPSDSDNA